VTLAAMHLALIPAALLALTALAPSHPAAMQAQAVRSS